MYNNHCHRVKTQLQLINIIIIIIIISSSSSSNSSSSIMAGVKDNIGRQIQTPVQWNSSISETVRNRTHVRMHFLLRMTDTMTSQNIDISSWDTLYMQLVG